MQGFARTLGDRDDCGDVQQQLDLVSLALDAAGDSIIHRSHQQRASVETSRRAILLQRG